MLKAQVSVATKVVWSRRILDHENVLDANAKVPILVKSGFFLMELQNIGVVSDGCSYSKRVEKRKSRETHRS
jgi:hypothetical protein